MSPISDTSISMAVDTSGRFGSVALGRGDQLLVCRTFSGMMRHSAELFTTIQTLLAEVGEHIHQIREVYITAGPGSFTGLRIGVTLAKMLHFACRTKIVALSTLDVLAENVLDYMQDETVESRRVATVLDAKRGQFFVAIYDWRGATPHKILPDCLVNADEFVKQYADPENPIQLLGEGLYYYKDRFQSSGVEILDSKYWYPHAQHLYRLGRNHALLGHFADPVNLIPHYIRGPDAVEKALWGQPRPI